MQVDDADANADAGMIEQVTVTLETLAATGAGDDDATTITLTETAADTGVFLSDAQLLTSPDLPGVTTTDDDVAVWSETAGAFVADDATDNRTHRATIDSSVHVVYKAKADTIETSVPVTDRNPDKRRMLSVRVHVNLEPYNDLGMTFNPNAPGQPENYVGVRAVNGALVPFNYTVLPGATSVVAGDGAFTFLDLDGDSYHDPGERSEPYWDISRVHGTLATGQFKRGDVTPNKSGDGWGAIAPQSAIAAQLERANIAWAQAGVAVVQIGPMLFENAPPTPSISDQAWKTIIHDGYFDVTTTVNSLDVIPEVNQIDGSARFDVADVIFTTALRSQAINDVLGATGRPGNHGVGFPAQFSEMTYIFIGTQKSNIDIATSTALDPRLKTLAHEVGHALTNLADNLATDVIKYIFFPAATNGPDDDPTKFRRLTQLVGSQSVLIRQAGALGQIGNRLLLPPQP